MKYRRGRVFDGAPWLAALSVVFACCCWSPAVAQPPDKAKKAPGKKDAEPSGKQLILEGFELAKAKPASVDSLTKIIDLCQRGVPSAKNQTYADYGKRLAAWAYNKRGEARAAAQPPQEDLALADFEAAVNHDGGIWRYRHNRGVSYAVAGEFAKAVADFDAVLKTQPVSQSNFTAAKILFNRGEAKWRLKDVEGAIADYTAAVRRRQTADAYISRGFAYKSQGESRLAVNDFSLAIALDRRNHVAYTHRGNAYADRGNFRQAINDYQTAINLKPDYALVFYSAAWLRATCADPRFHDGARALRSAQRAVELDGKNYRFQDALAAAHARAGQFDEAVAAAKKALELVPDGNADAKKDLNARLELYEKKQAFVDVIADAGKKN